MKIFVDTSVLVAALIENHPHNRQAAELLVTLQDKMARAVISAHGLAETYAVLTRAPLTPRVHPAEAWQMLANILEHVQVVALNPDEYQQVIRRCSTQGRIGGAVYDAIHIHAAQSAGCERLYTFNLREFQALAPEELQARILTP